MNVRSSLVVITLALAGCAATPAAPPAITVAIPAVAPPPRLPAGCDALTSSYSPLLRLKSQSISDPGHATEPDEPEKMRAELAARVAAARAAKPADAEIAKLVDDVDVRFSTMEARLHDFIEARAASHEEDARAAIDALLAAAKGSDDFLAASHRRCDDRGPARSPSGRLSPELIQKVVRARFGEYRKCYEDGLRRDPTLEGRFSIRFVINRDGHVSNVMNADDVPSDAFSWHTPKDAAKRAPQLGSLPDPRVGPCVIEAFRKLVFPAPEGGIVTVTYPLMFALGG